LIGSPCTGSAFRSRERKAASAVPLRHRGWRGCIAPGRTACPFVSPCIHPRFPRPANPCLQSPHPVTDTLPGVAARRGWRVVWGRDARPHAPGLRKMVSLRRHGGSNGVSDRSRRFMPQTARRMCLCGTQGGRDWRMRRHRPPGGTQAGRPKPSVGIARACGFDVKTAMGPPGNRRTTSAIPAFAEGPESRAKTAERGAERCHIHYFNRGSFQRPVRMLFEPTGGNPPRGPSSVETPQASS